MAVRPHWNLPGQVSPGSQAALVSDQGGAAVLSRGGSCPGSPHGVNLVEGVWGCVLQLGLEEVGVRVVGRKNDTRPLVLQKRPSGSGSFSAAFLRFLLLLGPSGRSRGLQDPVLT
jgi:hypothetical protein